MKYGRSPAGLRFHKNIKLRCSLEIPHKLLPLRKGSRRQVCKPLSKPAQPSAPRSTESHKLVGSRFWVAVEELCSKYCNQETPLFSNSVRSQEPRIWLAISGIYPPAGSVTHSTGGCITNSFYVDYHSIENLSWYKGKTIGKSRNNLWESSADLTPYTVQF